MGESVVTLQTKGTDFKTKLKQMNEKIFAAGRIYTYILIRHHGTVHLYGHGIPGHRKKETESFCCMACKYVKCVNATVIGVPSSENGVKRVRNSNLINYRSFLGRFLINFEEDAGTTKKK